MLREFRWTIAGLTFALILGALVLWFTPAADLDGKPATIYSATYGAWMAMLAQPIVQQLPTARHLMLLFALYPVLGFIFIGEGIVRLAILMVSRKYGRKEWMRIVASTYNDHIILCGLGHLGLRVLEQLVAAGQDVVVLEKSRSNPLLVRVKELNVPILIRDMKEDQALIDAGVERASAVVIATNDDMANLEVALDSRRLNSDIRVVMRLFEQQLASKLSDALDVDVAFSSSAIAAPMVAAMSLKAKVISSAVIGGVPHVVSEISIEPASRMAGRRIDELETGYCGRILARTPAEGPCQSPPTGATVVQPGDTLVVHVASGQLATIAAAARAGGL